MKLFGIAAAATLVACVATGAQAQDSGWEYEGSIYLFGSAISGKTSSGAEFEVPFDTLLENLNFGIAGTITARNGDYMWSGDISVSDIGAEADGSIPVGPVSVPGKLDTTVRETILQLNGGYRLVDTADTQLYGTAGVRYLKIGVDLEGEIGRFQFSSDSSDDYLDMVVGLNGRSQISDNFFIPYVVDVGAGQSDLTWQVFAGVGYTYGSGDIVLGYRKIDWDLGEDESTTDYTKSGPSLAWHFRF